MTDSLTTPGSYLHTAMLGTKHFLAALDEIYAEKRGVTVEVAKDTYMNVVAEWFVDNGVNEIEIPIMAHYSEDFIDGMDTGKNLFMKEINKAKNRVVGTMKMEW